MGKPNWFLTQGLSAERGGIAEGNSFVRVEPPQASGVCVFGPNTCLPTLARKTGRRGGGGGRREEGAKEALREVKLAGRSSMGRSFSFPFRVVWWVT